MQPELFLAIARCLACWRETLLTHGCATSRSLPARVTAALSWREMMDAVQRQQVRHFAGDHAGANQSRARFQLSADLAADTFTFPPAYAVRRLIRSLWNQWWLLPDYAVRRVAVRRTFTYPVEC